MYGVCTLCLWLALYSRMTTVSHAQIRETEICTRVQTFVNMMQVGIVTSPEASPEETRAVELANVRMRAMIAATLKDIPCGKW